MITFITNSGMGDCSWIFSKLDEFSKTHDIQFDLAADLSKRTAPFIGLHPRIKFRDYSTMGDKYIQRSTISMDTDLSTLKENNAYMVSFNQAMDNGRRVETIFPKEPTNFRYQLNFKVKHFEEAETLTHGELKIGIYGTCYSVLRHWNFWKEKEWIAFIKTFYNDHPNAVFHVIGASFDIDLADNIIKLLEHHRIPHRRIIGYHIGTALQVIKNLHYLFAFPSGLGIMANVLNVPTMMFMPSHLKKLSYTFVPLEDQKSTFFINPQFLTVPKAYDLFKRQGLKHMEERLANPI